MPRQVGVFQSAVITGTSAGATGAIVTPAGKVMVIWNIEYSNPVATGANVTVQGSPSGRLIDVKNIGANATITPAGGFPKGTLPSGDALQVISSVGNVIATTVFTIEDPADY